MRRIPREEELREPGLIERGVGWVLASQGFNVLVVIVSTSVLLWSSWKTLTHMAETF